MEQVALRARVHYEAKNCLILMDCSNAFNTVKRTGMLAEAASAASCVPAHTRSTPVFFQMDSGEKAYDRLLQRDVTRGRHGIGIVLHVAAAGAEADPRGVGFKMC